MSSKSIKHWYPRYTGDYSQKTKHLTMVQHGAYSMLLDYYYSTGKPLPSSDDQVMRVCCAFDGNERDAVLYVLGEFFDLTENGYTNKRVEEELEKRRDISEKRKSAVKAREDKRASLDISLDDTSTTTSTSTVTPKKDTPLPPKGDDGFSKMWLSFPRQRRGSNEKAQVAYKKALTKASANEIYSGVLSYAASEEVSRGYAKGCAAWLNDDRWSNDYTIQTGKPKEPTTLDLRNELLLEMNGDTPCLIESH